jgi:hypothetical protein
MSRSPFPGMDPYLEPHWLDIHTKLVAYSADALNVVLPQSLIARTEERIAIASEADEPHQLAPDVRVFEMVEQNVPDKPTRNGGGRGGSAVSARRVR